MDQPPVLDRRRPRLARLAGFALLGSVVSAAIVGLLLPLAIRVFVRTIELTLNGCVAAARSFSVGMSAWAVLRLIGRHALELMVSREATAVLTGLVLIAGVAGYALQRILASEEEPS